MACKMQRRIALRRKLQILRTLTKSKSEKKTKDTFLYIDKLKVQVEAMRKEVIDHMLELELELEEVKVEKLVAGAGYLIVRVRCKKGELVLASILQMFEELNVNVVQATITCKHFFGMDAILKADIDAPILNQAILNLLQKSQLIN